LIFELYCIVAPVKISLIYVIHILNVKNQQKHPGRDTVSFKSVTLH